VSVASESPQWAPACTPRSNFVTVTAWIFIGLSTFSTLISVLQNIMITVMFSAQGGFPPPEAQQHMPPLFAFLFSHMRLYFLAFLVVSAATLLASIGLLMRRNWARIAFIGILALGIVWNIGGLVLQQWLASSMLEINREMRPPAEFEAVMRGMMIAIRIFSALFAIGLSVLFGWMIRQLRSTAIAAEFR
jgi:hypothetical protein